MSPEFALVVQYGLAQPCSSSADGHTRLESRDYTDPLFQLHDHQCGAPHRLISTSSLTRTAGLPSLNEHEQNPMRGLANKLESALICLARSQARCGQVCTHASCADY